MELTCDVIVKDKRTGIVVSQASSVSSAQILEQDANGRVIYRFNFEFMTAVDKRLVDRIDQTGGENDETGRSNR